jgi:hypothetical protein
MRRESELQSGGASAGSRRSRRPIILAGVAVGVVIAAVILVLILAGGNKTTDGTGRDHIGTESPTNITNSSGNGAGGPVR